jgi:predicted RNase H-like HicB family nuclease
MNMKCTVVIQQEENWFVAICLENNVASQGKTLDGAIANLREALALFYEEEREIPKQRPVYVTALEVAESEAGYDAS